MRIIANITKLKLTHDFVDMVIPANGNWTEVNNSQERSVDR